MSASVAVWIIYENWRAIGTCNESTRFTARLWKLTEDGIVEPTLMLIRGDTLEYVRKRIPSNFTITDISDEDRENGIVEQWIA